MSKTYNVFAIILTCRLKDQSEKISLRFCIKHCKKFPVKGINKGCQIDCHFLTFFVIKLQKVVTQYPVNAMIAQLTWNHMETVLIIECKECTPICVKLI